MANIAELEDLAGRIPEMGGRRIGQFLRGLARETRPNTAIVELGCWLGAGTAQMAIGLHERLSGHGVTIDCFDNFHTSASSAEKAQKQGADIHEGQDTLPWVTNALEPFGPGITLHKGMLDERTRWDGRSISVYVDDASKYPHTFYRCLKIFGPSWIPGETTVVLMDYWLFKKKHNAHRVETMRAQYDFITARPEHFEPIEALADGTCAAFRYTKAIDFGALPMPPAALSPTLNFKSVPPVPRVTGWSMMFSHWGGQGTGKPISEYVTRGAVALAAAACVCASVWFIVHNPAPGPSCSGQTAFGAPVACPPAP